jgi:hypothetical protein
MTCAQCEKELQHRTVTLVIEYERSLHFCDDRCEHRWLVADRARLRAALRRIYTTHRISGRAREIAHVALTERTP